MTTPRPRPRRRIPRVWLLLVVALASAVLAGPAFGSSSAVTSISGNEWTCTYTNPEYMIHAGGANLRVTPGKATFSMAGAVTTRSVQPYISAGYLADLNSQMCNSRGGKSFALPVLNGRQGHPLATVTDWTSSNYHGNTGFDIWLTANPANNTYTKLTSQGGNTTEIMVWLSHPRLGSYKSSWYGVVIGGRRWLVTVGLASAGHGKTATDKGGWNVVNFIAPDTSTGNVTVHNLSLDDFASYAISHHWLNAKDYWMAVDQGAEVWPGGEAAVTSYSMTGLN